MSNLDYEHVTDWLQFNQDISALVTKLLHTASNLHLSDSALAEMTATNKMRISWITYGAPIRFTGGTLIEIGDKIKNYFDTPLAN